MQLLVNIDVDDLDRAARFYTTGLDLTVGRRIGDDAVELLGAPCAIWLLRQYAGTPATPTTAHPRTYARHWTPVHLDFVVDDVDAAVAKAIEAGATLEAPVRTAAWGRLALLADPFGHGFCIVQLVGRGYDVLAGA